MLLSRPPRSHVDRPLSLVDRSQRALLPAGAAASNPSSTVGVRRGGVGHNVRFAAVALAALASGCADDAESSGPGVLRTTQEPLPLACDDKNPSCYEAELTAHPTLSQLADAVQAEDAARTLQAAGVLTDAKGRRLVWGEYAPSANPARTEARSVFALCDAAGAACTYGTATPTERGVTLRDASGKDLDTLAFGAPVMRKVLKAHNVDKDPTLLAPLNQSHTVDAALSRETLAQVQFGVRRLVILSAFGPQVGVQTSDLEQAAKQTGRFDSIETIHFARRSDLERLLPTLTALDVVVVLAPGVFEQFNTKGDRPLGVALSRGVFGDELVSGKTVSKLLPAPPLGGPGLIVLAGSQTASAEYDGDNGTLASVLNDGLARPVVGVSGVVQVGSAKAAVRGLLAGLAANKPLSTAMAGAGQPLHSPLPAAEQAKWRLAAATSKFWGNTQPKTAAYKLHFLPSPPTCTDAATACDVGGYLAGINKSKVPPTSIDAVHASFECEPTLSGPFFQCTTEAFSVKGILSGRAQGDRMWVWVDGTASDRLRNVTAVGVASIDGVDAAGGSQTIRFSGLAAASPYESGDDGWCCTAGTPLLTTTKGEPGTLVWQP